MKLIVFISILFLAHVGYSQKSTVFFHIDKITVKKKVVQDSTNFKRYEQKAIDQFRLNGYLGIALKDSVVKNNGTHYYYSYSHKFSKVVLETTFGKKQKIKSNRTKDFVNAVTTLDESIKQLENNGYPFAKINFIEQIEDGDKLTLKYEIDSGDFFFIDKIHLKSQDKFHDKTIFNLIDLHVGEKYNEKKLANINNLLSASGMYNLSRPIEVLFKPGKAEVFIYFKRKRSSTGDGYIGFQQDQITQKLALNGFLNFRLLNAFNHAEVIHADWKSNPDKTQNGHLKVAYPFLFNTPLGIGGELDIRKQDSTFIRTDLSFNLSYYHPLARFTIFNQLESSDTLRVAPPNFRSYRKNTIGATAELIAPVLSNAPWYHPRIHLMGGFFNYRNDTLDDGNQKINNSKYTIEYSHSIDFLKFFRLNNRIQFQGLTSNITLARNELVYFGGLRSVRGFYELELSGNDIWSIMNEVEFRPVDLFSIFLLYDFSSFQSNGHHITNSYGVGFSFNAENYALEIVVANGVLDNNPFQFSNTKIHIGFRSTF